jgi:hypothetical protein
MTEASFAGNLTDQPEIRHTESGSARSTVEVVANELGPSLRWTTARAGQDLQGQRQLATRVAALTIGRSTANGIGRSPTGEVVLLSTIAAFAVPAALGVAQALPAMESEPATPGLGHRGLLGHSPYRLDKATLYPDAGTPLVLPAHLALRSVQQGNH